MVFLLVLSRFSIIFHGFPWFFWYFLRFFSDVFLCFSACFGARFHVCGSLVFELPSEPKWWFSMITLSRSFVPKPPSLPLVQAPQTNRSLRVGIEEEGVAGTVDPHVFLVDFLLTNRSFVVQKTYN